MATSKKSERFEAWLSDEDLKYKLQYVVALELAARLATHDLDTMGEISEPSLRALARASKLLQEAYENKA